MCFKIHIQITNPKENDVGDESALLKWHPRGALSTSDDITRILEI